MRNKSICSRLTLFSLFFLYFTWGFLIYFPFLKAQYKFDDVVLLEKNPIYQNEDWKNIFSYHQNELADEQTGYFHRSGYYRPLVMISYLVDKKIAQIIGIDPRFLHNFTQILLHILNSFLLFLILKGITPKTSFSIDSSLLFLLHPWLTHTVAWVSGRQELLGVFFSLLAFLMWLKKQGWFYLFFLLLSLFSKETFVVFPIAMILFARFYGEKKIPWFLLMGLLVMIFRISLVDLSFVAQNFQESPWDDRLIASIEAFMRSFVILVFPHRLQFIYETPLFLSSLKSFFLYLIFSFLLVYLFWRFVEKKLFIIGMGIFVFFSLIPILFISSHLDSQPYFLMSHNFYAASIGVLLCLGGFLNRWRKPLKGAVIILFSVYAFSRVTILTSELKTMWDNYLKEPNPLYSWCYLKSELPDLPLSYENKVSQIDSIRNKKYLQRFLNQYLRELSQRKDWDRFQKILELYRKKIGYDYLLEYRVGLYFYQAEKFSQAYQQFINLYRIEGPRPHILLGLFYSCYRLGRWDEALRWASRISPEDIRKDQRKYYLATLEEIRKNLQEN